MQKIQSNIEVSKLKEEAVKDLYKEFPSGIATNLVAALIVAALLWDQTERTKIISWITVFYLVFGIRLWVYTAYKKRFENNPVKFWLRAFYISLFASAATWAFGVLLLFPYNSQIHQLTFAIIVYGIVSGTNFSYSYLKSPPLIYNFTVAPALIYVFYKEGSAVSYIMIFSLIVAISYYGVSTLRKHRAFIYNAQSRISAQTSEAKLLESQTRLKTVFENMSDALIMIDSKGLVDSFNPAAEAIFGYTSEEVCGKSIALLMPKGYSPQHSSGIAPILSRVTEIDGRQKNGNILPLEVAVNQMDVAGENFFCAIIRDITDRKAKETEILDAKESAEKANAAKSVFLSRMSHELRTPLNAILGFSQLMAYDKEAFTGEHQEDLKNISDAGDHLLNLVNDVLDVASIDSGKLAINLKTIDINKTINDAIRLISPLAADRNISIEHDRNTTHTSITADQQRVRQILINLLSNAVKYNHEGGKVLIKTTKNDSDYLHVNVTDTGPGIGPMETETIFEPFYRNPKNTDNIEGSGIGLTICRQLAELMGGSIKASSTPGNGSTFTLALPFNRKS